MSRLMTRLVSSYLFSRWNRDMRTSHPCPVCKDIKARCWLGKICDSCQKTFNIGCPCTQPILGYPSEDRCQRCGYAVGAKDEKIIV